MVTEEHRHAAVNLPAEERSADSFPNAAAPGRRIRVGYMSPDFRRHSVSIFLEPILENHDHSDFEIFAYSDVAKADGVTERLRSLTDVWREIHGKNDQEVIDLVMDDQIDILVDLAGHTAGNRLALFARRAAPVQVAFLGYPNTTGLSTMDYRITDECSDPTGTTDAHYRERLFRLPRGFLCYRPPPGAPEVKPPPSAETGAVTFGSFNDIAKVTPELVALWSSLLRSVPGAEFLLKSRALSDGPTREHVLGLFAQNGIHPGRVRLSPPLSSLEAHLSMYGEMDVALDTFPYCGTTTTLEALWMGVPVVTLAGPTHVSRVGVSILSAAGRGEWIALTPEDYLLKATDLTAQPEKLEGIRDSLRGELQSSALLSPEEFAEGFESSLRTAWNSRLSRSAAP